MEDQDGYVGWNFASARMVGVRGAVVKPLGNYSENSYENG
jgi:hypothetical protein